ncbi:protein tyrosine phosphatase family protein [Parahaliea mediterranea]|uniref:Protein tyrosine phosphatase family protein n=1 Tax=Parahaliea mediterranea TaxID=651086 RepID=A0A939DCR7_9GAMM|nr:protein tyrosine phosphatase family protein [Parahaliea mediterranea]MBN7795756.1 protein tyrosine phosphatase family protein [Parahaliea mediterranea]
MSVERAFNFRPVSENVATSGLLNEEQLSALGASGYEAVINLLPHDSQYAIPGEEAIVAGQGIDYFYIPVDFAHPVAEDYAAFVRAMGACRGKRLLIHCAANYRVSAFYAIYAWEHLGWSATRAREHIASIWQLEDNPPWESFIATYIPGGG